MSESLRSLVQSATDIECMLVDAGGEITEEIEALLSVKDVQLPAKIDSYAFLISRMETVSDFYKAKADTFLKLSKAANSVIDRCEDNLMFAMKELNIDELEGFDMKFKLRKSPPSCVIDDESKIDPAYKITETITKIDKRKMLEDLKLGIPCEGAHMTQNLTVKAVANTPGKGRK